MKRKTRDRIVASLEIATAIILTSVSFTAGYIAGQSHNDVTDEDPHTYAEVRVVSGDKLWNICREYCPDNIDIRSYISNTMMLNGMTNSDIYPGDVIKVRVYD